MLTRIALNGMVVVGLAFGTTVCAQESSGPYLGTSIGVTSVEASGVDFDSSATSFKVLGGYAFNDNFAVELAWFDRGSAKEHYLGGSLEVESTGLNASAIGRLPLGQRFALFGKLGYASYDVDVSARVTGQTIFSAEGSDEDLSYGVGGEVRIVDQFNLRAEYEIIDVSDGEFNFLSIGGVFRF